MILDLRHIEEFPAHSLCTAGNNEFLPFAEEVVEVKSVRFDARVQKSEPEYFVQGTVMAEVTLTCSRCARVYQATLTEDTDFIIGPTMADGEEIEDKEEHVYFSANEMVTDVSEPVRQALLLSLGLKPLCSESCKGLCPSCGTNLNERTCACGTESIDPRWEALRKLRDRGANPQRG